MRRDIDTHNKTSWLTCGILFLAFGCGQRTPKDKLPANQGRVLIGLSISGERFDVSHVRFVVTRLEDQAPDGVSFSTTVPLSQDPLPPEKHEGLAGNRFANWVLIVPTGEYLVEAQPLTSGGGKASQICHSAAATTRISEGASTPLTLESQCGAPAGVLDLVTVLKSGILVESITFRDGSNISCPNEAEDLTVEARQATEEPLVWEWTVRNAPDGVNTENVCLVSKSGQIMFAANQPGAYDLGARIFGSAGQSSQENGLSIPLFVSSVCGGASSPPGGCPGDAIPEAFKSSQNVTLFGRCDCEQESQPFRVETDRISYCQEDNVGIEGIVPEENQQEAVTIRVTAPDGQLVAVAQLQPRQDRSYQTTIVAGGPLWDTEGLYTIRAGSGALGVDRTFHFSHCL